MTTARTALLLFITLAASGYSVAQTDPSGRRLHQVKPPPADTGWTGIQQVGVLAKSPPPAPASPLARGGGCSVTPSPASSCSAANAQSQHGVATASGPAASALPSTTVAYQHLRMGKIDFDPDADAKAAEQVKAAVLAKYSNKPPGARPATPPRGYRPPAPGQNTTQPSAVQ